MDNSVVWEGLEEYRKGYKKGREEIREGWACRKGRKLRKVRKGKGNVERMGAMREGMR